MDTTTLSSLERLAPELFLPILSQITEPRDLASFCRASSTIYRRVVPKLYHTFSYHGIKHSKESLKRFFCTVLWRDDLAACVEVLDLGEWGDCPKLEDWVGEPWVREEEEAQAKMEAEEREKKIKDGGDVKMEDAENDVGRDENGNDIPRDVGTDDKTTRPPYFRILADDSDDSDYEASESSESDDSHDVDADSDIETESGGYLGRSTCIHKPDFYDILRDEARALGFAYENFLQDYYAATWDIEKELADEGVMVRLIPLLRNVHTLYLMPIDDSWADTKYLIKDMIVDSVKEGGKPVLAKLETLYICSSLHLGTKHHREYELELAYFLPFTQLPSIRTLKALTAYTTDDMLNNEPLDLASYASTSPITTLNLEESALPPRDGCLLLSVPKALTHLRWSQDAGCGGAGYNMCTSPFYSLIGLALQQHKSTLTHLDLDIRQRQCTSEHHRSNPFVTLEGFMRIFSPEDAQRLWDQRAPKSDVLLGSMSNFLALRVLSVDVMALCGHQHWAKSPTAMVEQLPKNLHTLNLRLKVKPVNPTGDGSAVWDCEGVMDQVLDLLRRKETYVPGLKRLGFEVFPDPRRGLRVEEGGSWEWEGLGEGGGMGLALRMVRDACGEAGVEFSVREGKVDVVTKEPWFVEQSSVRNWGRDW